MLLKFQDLVTAHVKWREKTAELLAKGASDHVIKTVRSDKNCEIGKWLHGEGFDLFSDLPEFQAAKDAHLKFHHAAAHAATKDGNLGGEEELSEMLQAFVALNDRIGHLD